MQSGSLVLLLPHTTVQHTTAMFVAAYEASSQGIKGIGAGCISVRWLLAILT